MTVTKDNVADLVSTMKELSQTRVMVGVPAEKAGRSETEGQPINNATLMYIHEHGAPEVNIPARPVLGPGVESIKSQIPGFLSKAAQEALSGNRTGMMQALNALGLLAQNAVRKRITDGPFVPLKPGTIAARRAKGRTGTKPLIDTGQLRRALTYVIRRKGDDVGGPE